MGSGIALLVMLVAVFAMAGVHHLMIWIRDRVRREYLWFALASFAATGALVSAINAAHGISVSFSLTWLIATTWFTIEYAEGDQWRRRIAILVTLLFTLVLVGNLALPMVERWSDGVDMPLYLRVTGAAGIALLFGLVVDGSFRLWHATSRIRAVTLGVGIGIALFSFSLHGLLLQWGVARFPSPTPYAFLIAVVAMTYELANTVAEIRRLSQRQRQELVHASRLSVVGELTASIAHEINQPLGAILSNADAGEILLENPNPPLDEIRQILADIRRDGLRASDVIRHVRALVRKRELELEKLDANAVATNTIALLEQEARRRRIFVTSALSPQPAWLRGDRALLEQMLINLILNAMDAVEAMSAADAASSLRPPIVLGVSTTGHGEVEFQLVDAGPGIPPEHLSHLFDSFYTSKPHGMGLGLSITRSIVEAHGGRIRADNTPDAGARFRITLPPYEVLEG